MIPISYFFKFYSRQETGIMSPFIRSGPHEVFKQIIRCYFCSFYIRMLFWGQKGALRQNISPYYEASFLIFIS